MKIVKIIALILLVGFVGIQFVPTDLNQSDTVPKTDFLLVNNTQENISALLQESCYDCHSNNTEYPWYNKGLLYTSPSPRDRQKSRMPSSA